MTSLTPRGIAIWGAVATALIVPVVIAANSPFLPSRNPAYVVAGFAGIIALALFLIQPAMVAGYLPGPAPVTARRWHRWIGSAVVICVVLHVGGLYLTSAPDTLDALLLVSPTPFSVYGVIAMWGVILTALLVALRRRIRLRPVVWRGVHNALALVVVIATVIHALQIDGTMGPTSKAALCAAVIVVSLSAVLDLRLIRPLRRRRAARRRAAAE